MKRITTLLLALMACITFANAEVYNGTCGENLTWSLNTEDSTLTIEGTGAMSDWNNYPYAPWSKNQKFIRYISLPDGLTYIGAYAFNYCLSLTSVTIPNSVTSIGKNAFGSCSNLISVEIPNGVKTIGESAFGSCRKLSSIQIPTSVTSIGNYAFSACTNIGSLSVPNSVKTIGTNAFGYIKNVIYNGTATGSPWDAQCINGYIEESLVYQNSSKSILCACLPDATGEITIPNSVYTIKPYAFAYCTGITSVLIPESITEIPREAFSDCENIVLFGIPNTVINIERGAFARCKSLQSITIPDGVSEIKATVFQGCNGLTSITLSNNTTSIGNMAFAACNSLASIVLPQHVDSIDSWAFEACTSLTSITSEATTPPFIFTSTFPSYDIPLYVPIESENLYRTANVWKNFTDIRRIGNIQIVRFLDWDSSEIAKVLVPNGTAATPPADPTRIGYTFIGWDKDFSNVTEDMTITAQYEINRYKVDFLDWDNSVLKTDSVEYLYPAITPKDPSREGYTFIGWDKTVNEVVQDTTITALYDINYYPVVLLGHDGKLLSKQTVAYKHAAQQPEVPAREGYTFSGWSTDIESIVDSTYAIALYDKIGGTVTYLSEEGDVIASENVDLHLPAAPVIAGKSFKGWLTESADSENGIVLRATYTSDNPTISEDVTVTPSSNSADVSFPFITGALTYELVIRDLSGNVVCKIMFNSFGQLLGIAFAPSRNRNQQATQSTGFNFTVEGLNASTTYKYEFVAYDDTDDAIETLSGSFTTTADTPMNIDNAPAANAPQKYIQDGHLFIDNNDRTFDALGQQVR